MRWLVLIVLLCPLQVYAELPEDEKLMRVVVELEELHKVTRDVSEFGRVDAARPFPYDRLLVEISNIRSAVLRHVQKPSRLISKGGSKIYFPSEVSLNAKEKNALRAVVNQCDSVLSVIPVDTDSSAEVMFNYPALKQDVARLKNYVWEVIVTGELKPRRLTAMPE